MVVREAQDVPGAHTESPPEVNPRSDSPGACHLRTTPAAPRPGAGVILVGQGCNPAPTRVLSSGCHIRFGRDSLPCAPTHHGALQGEAGCSGDDPAAPRVTGEYTQLPLPIMGSGSRLTLGHADQPIDLSEPREAARLSRNKGPKRCIARPRDAAEVSLNLQDSRLPALQGRHTRQTCGRAYQGWEASFALAWL